MSIADIAAAQGSGQNRCLITHNTTWIVPTGVKNIWITACAAGEDGSDSDPDYIAKAGDFIIEEHVSVIPGQPIPIVVGRGNTVIGDLFTLMAGVLEGNWENDKLGITLGALPVGITTNGANGGKAAAYISYDEVTYRNGATGGNAGKNGYSGAFGIGGIGGAGGGGRGAKGTEGYFYNHSTSYATYHRVLAPSNGGSGGNGGFVSYGKHAENIVLPGTPLASEGKFDPDAQWGSYHYADTSLNPAAVSDILGDVKSTSEISTEDLYTSKEFYVRYGEKGEVGTKASGFVFLSNVDYELDTTNGVAGIGGKGGKGADGLNARYFGAGGGSVGARGGGNGGEGGKASKGAPGMVLIEW